MGDENDWPNMPRTRERRPCASLPPIGWVHTGMADAPCGRLRAAKSPLAEKPISSRCAGPMVALVGAPTLEAARWVKAGEGEGGGLGARGAGALYGDAPVASRERGARQVHLCWVQSFHRLGGDWARGCHAYRVLCAQPYPPWLQHTLTTRSSHVFCPPRPSLNEWPPQKPLMTRVPTLFSSSSLA